MMVTFVSQCEKRALTRTRRVLDAFADRIGDNTWQTVITQEGLQAVKKLLRKTASKNTAVSCHWIRSRSRSELVWVVGNRRKFDEKGIVPVNSTQKKLLQQQWENNWHYLPLIKALAALAALLHDWGKATRLFQDKLRTCSKKGDPVRHEWISCLLFYLFVHAGRESSDEDWLQRFNQGNIDEDKLKRIATDAINKPLKDLPNGASLLCWLIMSHHRMPECRDINSWQGETASSLAKVLSRITLQWGYQNQKREDESSANYSTRFQRCFEFPEGLFSQSKPWLRHLKKWSQRFLESLPLLEKAMQDGSWRLLLHHARLSLMLGDHFYSSQDPDVHWRSDIELFANTYKTNGNLKQKLDEHLTGVMQAAIRTCHMLPAFETEPPQVSYIPELQKKSPARFAWQDIAAGKFRQWRQHTDHQACFIVNMAGTGCGKTMANAKVMRALSDDGKSLRYVLALGLRTLTLQTGDEYRNRIGLDSSELAVLIGSKAVMDLHKSNIQTEAELTAQSGSESAQSLLEEDIDYDCDIPDEGLATVLHDQRARKFLYAPVLACTIDHIMSATETRRGGRYILPSLRLMSSDLVIDEVDDFTGSDLIAIARIVHLAGMLGRKVMISSATIPPDLAEGFFNAYREGWQLFCRARNLASTVTCGWIDEFSTVIDQIAESDNGASNGHYRSLHLNFAKKRADKLKQQPPKRKGRLIECRNLLENKDESDGDSRQEQYFTLCQQAIAALHQQHHSTDGQTGKKVSFGVVRVANISPCIALTQYLLSTSWPADTDVRVMAYHGRQVLLLRHEQEKHLDAVLKRKEKEGEQPVAFASPVIRTHLDGCDKPNLIFILVATPVEEVGRDHDFDWAVIEPSSYRSIIQLAGRVWRHRNHNHSVQQPNVALLQYNLRALRGEKKAFLRPGYESDFKLETHDLCGLLDIQSISESIDAIPRILKPEPLNHKNRLADLEHFATGYWLCRYQGTGPDDLQGWLTGCWWLTALPQRFHPFRKSTPTTRLYLVWDGEDTYFAERDGDGKPVPCDNIYAIKHEKVATDHSERLWLFRNYRQLLEERADMENMSLERASMKYGEIAITDYGGYSVQEFIYNDQYGMNKK